MAITNIMEAINAIAEGSLRAAALIASAQKAEHYEIASYGTPTVLARQLDHTNALSSLLETLEAERATDEKLTLLAEQVAIRPRPETDLHRCTRRAQTRGSNWNSCSAGSIIGRPNTASSLRAPAERVRLCCCAVARG